MSDYKRIYAEQPDQYDLLVEREDYRGNLIAKIDELKPLAGIDVVELGAGTGRITRLLAPRVRSVRAFDASEPMLGVAKKRAVEAGHGNCTFARGMNESLPCESASADLAIAGWTLGHLPRWHPDDWRDHVAAAVGEMRRVLRPGGAVIIIDTLGTGREIPLGPTEGLGEYRALLENEHGFTRHWIRTDYEFESVAEAERLTRFFFGNDIADRIVKENWRIVPECTGVWVRNN